MERNFKILKIDHVAIATNSISNLNIFGLLGMKESKLENVESEKVNVAKFIAADDNHVIELLEPSTETSTIKNFLNKNGQGLHHISLQVDNIFNAIKFLDSNNIKIIYKKPRVGADNKLITFIHPKSTPGILIELSQDN